MYRWHRIAAALPLVIVACNTDRPLGPTGPQRRLELSTTTAPGLPTPISNAVKYRDQGLKPATGREGSASLMVRALMDKYREVDLDVTTGTEDDLNAGRGPGNLDKIQLKMFDPQGNHISTTNYNKLKNGGYAQYGLSHLVRGGGVQVQSNVSGIDPNRNDVVTVLETVKLRPDLAVQKLVAPEKARVQTLVNISATVAELNGDVGARGNCLLFVDGTEVDRASGIWVDAMSSVTCAFAFTFTSTGSKSLRIAVTDVVPGDYETDNNEVYGSIDITSINEFYNWGSVHDMDFTNTGRDRYQYLSSTYNYESQRSWAANGWYQYASMNSFKPQPILFPLSIQIRHLSGGTEVLSETVNFSNPDWSSSWYKDQDNNGSNSCVAAYGGSGRYSFVYLCTGSDILGGLARGYTNIQQGRNAGEVSYFSKGYSKHWYQNSDGSSYYFWNYTWDVSDTYTYGGTRLAMTAGSEYLMQAVLMSGTEILNAELPVQLNAFRDFHSVPYTEFSFSVGGYTHSGYFEQELSYAGVRGWNSNAPDK